MAISIKNVEDVIKGSLQKSINTGVNNRLRSSIFVSNVADGLYSFYKDSHDDLKLRMIGFDEELLTRVEGEKMLDISIARTKKIADPGKANSEAEIDYQLIWAVESEASTSLPAFADDFGKLLCVKSNNYLYLNGLDQLQEKSRTSYMERRIEIAKQMLAESGLDYGHYYYAFWPSPASNKAHKMSFWDMHQEDDLLNMVRVFEL